MAADMHPASATASGHVKGWGDNGYGQLGNASTTNSTTPVDACTSTAACGSNPFTGASAVSAGGTFSLAVKAGEAWAWGGNELGQLGNGPIPSDPLAPPLADSTTPVKVNIPSAAGGITAVAAGTSHGLALSSTGQVFAWGSNASGELGIDCAGSVGALGGGLFGDMYCPTPMAVPVPHARAIAAGTGFSLALTETGQVLGWGDGAYGQLGTGGSSRVPKPVNLPPGAITTAVAAAGFHSLALTTEGKVVAWGSNQKGQNGTGFTSPTGHSIPLYVCDVGSSGSSALVPDAAACTHLPDATGIAAGNRHSLVLKSDGSLVAWGENHRGQLGTGTNDANAHVRPEVVNLPAGTAAKSVSGGGADHSLALTDANPSHILAWGSNASGELGYSTGATTCSSIACSKSPVELTSPTGTAKSVAAGGGFTVAVIDP